MRLIRLELTNFRQHADTVVEFRPGLTGIIGPNGSGKTTILEGIAWAIYGAQAVRGTNDTLRFNRAPGRSTVAAELELELSGERYRLRRTLRNAELYLGDSPDPIAAGVTEVTRQVTRRLGMNRDEFFNTYFTGQKELQFLAAMTPMERARFLSQVLGYERLRAAQGRVREERNRIRGEVETLRQALGDPEELAEAVKEAEARVLEATEKLEAAERRETEAAARLSELEPAYRKLQEARERDQRLDSDLRVARTRLEDVESRREQARAELAELEGTADELEELRERSKPLKDLEVRGEELARLKEAERRRTELSGDLDRIRGRVEELSEEARALGEQAEAAAELREEVGEQQAECERLEKERDDLRSNWQRDRQDAEAQLRMLRDRAEELSAQIEDLEEAGSEGVCPTCERPLGEVYGRVLSEVQARYDEVVQDGRWFRSRVEQLSAEPDEVAAVTERLAGAREGLNRLRERLSAAESAGRQAARRRQELEAEQARARERAGELAELPEGYDLEEHEEVRARIEELRQVEKRATQLAARLEARPKLKRQRAEAEEEAKQIRSRIEALENDRRELGFSLEEYREFEERFESAREDLQTARVDAERARGELETARAAAESARAAEEAYRRRASLVEEREADHRLHNELDRALGALREDLNARVRPELSEIASAFLAELTDGRYNAIEIDENYEIVVLDDGEEKPVISGGEEDLANLVLRLAISQMIADRAGQTLSLLIFDEVFGGLDDLRRESVVQLLQRLQDRFEQVVLITHIESIREGMDQVVRVRYDERSGASVVGEESPGASDEELEVEDLAVLVTE